MESSAFWRDLRREFQDLSVGVPQGQSLYAIDHDDGTWAVGGGPDDEMERAALRRRFRALAERAAAAAGLPLAGDLQDSWLTLLKSGPRYAPMELCQTGDTGSRSLDRTLANRLSRLLHHTCNTGVPAVAASTA